MQNPIIPRLRKTLFRFSQIILVVIFTTILMSSLNAQTQPQVYPRTNPNLIGNSEVSSPSGWALYNNAVFDGQVSHTLDNSGSFKISQYSPGACSTIESVGSKIPVTAGKTYSISAFMKSTRKYAIASLMVAGWDANKQRLGNVGGTRQSTSQAGVWQEITILYTVKEGEAYLTVKAYRNNGSDNTGDIWLDDFYVGEAISFENPPARKVTFDGARTRVDSLGNYEINRNGTWEPFFPFAVYQNNALDLSIYSQQGFNTFLLLPGYSAHDGPSATSRFNPYGMMALYDFSRYVMPPTVDGAPNNESGNVEGLKAAINTIKADPYNKYVLSWYWDDEELQRSVLGKQVTDAIRQTAVTSTGQRLWPIHIHEGNRGITRSLDDAVDTVGDYLNNGLGFNNITEISNIEGQNRPVTMGMISTHGDRSAAGFRRRFYQGLIAGVKGILVYKDPTWTNTGLPGDPMSSLELWGEIPILRGEIDKMLPILRQPQWTSWSMVPKTYAGFNASPIQVAKRDYSGKGYMIMVNTSSNTTATVKYTVSNLSYVPAKVMNFLTGASVTTVSSVSSTSQEFTISLPPSGAGVYYFEPTTVIVNQAPIVNAGSDKFITLPINSVLLSASASDTTGNIVRYLWSQVSGPSTATTFSSKTTVSTTVGNLVTGTYTFRLSATDSFGAVGSDTVNVVVKPANNPPIAKAGADKTITLPNNSVTLSDSGSTDPEGSVLTYSWTQQSGPSAATSSAPTSSSTIVGSLVEGTYTFRLTVKDNLNATGYDDVIVTVKPANIAPVSFAGDDQTITGTSTTLTGSGKDVDGTIVKYLWSQPFGPTIATYGDKYSATTTVGNLIPGKYTFRLSVYDNGGLKGMDYVTITVQAQVTTSTVTREFLIDFGASGIQSPTADPAKAIKGWNNLTTARKGDGLLALKDVLGNSSSINMTITDSFWQQTVGISNQDGTTASTLFPASATSDSFFIGNYSGFSDPTAKVQFSNLSTKATYSVRIFASRMASDTSDRTTIYTINGVSKSLQARNNVDGYVQFDNVPASAGLIEVGVSLKSGAIFGYLGVIDITETTTTP